MKTSNRILIITGIVIVILVLASIIGSRVLISKYSNSYDTGEVNYSNIEKKYTEISDFTGLNIRGDWSIALNKVDTFSITVSGRKGTEDLYKIYKKENTLFLAENTELNLNSKLKVNIIMPEISEIYSEGSLKLNLVDFVEPELILNLTGGTWVEGSNCKFENLYVTNAGAINLDFKNIPTNNADLQLAGAGNVELKMNGGSLTGNASGAMNIEYSGKADQRLVAVGIAHIGRKD